MLHSKAQGHWPFGSGEEDFWRDFTIYGRGSLVIWPRCPEHTFVPPTHGDSTWNLASIGPAVLKKKIFENGGQTDDTGACLYYKLINEPKGSGELKIDPFLNIFHDLDFFFFTKIYSVYFGGFF